jgi:hypothetical protein
MLSQHVMRDDGTAKHNCMHITPSLISSAAAAPTLCWQHHSSPAVLVQLGASIHDAHT